MMFLTGGSVSRVTTAVTHKELVKMTFIHPERLLKVVFKWKWETYLLKIQKGRQHRQKESAWYHQGSSTKTKKKRPRLQGGEWLCVTFTEVQCMCCLPSVSWHCRCPCVCLPWRSTAGSPNWERDTSPASRGTHAAHLGTARLKPERARLAQDCKPKRKQPYMVI